MPVASQARLLSDAEISAIAKERGISQKDAMLQVLAEGVWPLRFARNRDIFTASQQAALLKLRILIVGCGGLGGWVADFLVRMGAGFLRLCDGDAFEESNLNRQRFCNTKTIGQLKAVCAYKELAAIAPYLEMQIISLEVDADSLPNLLKDVAVAIDCLDSVPRKKMLESACANSGVSYLHGAVLGQDSFIYLDRPGKSRLEALYANTPAANCGTGGSNVLATTVAGAASLMGAMLINAFILGRPAPAQMIHADFSLPLLDMFEL